MKRVSAIWMFAWTTLASAARAECPAPESAGGKLPPRWRAAVDALVRSAREPGHPWSCSGGAIDLELTPHGAVLRVSRPGARDVSRTVTEPEDVVPLGQALLATPLPAPPAAPEPVVEPPAPPPVIVTTPEPRDAPSDTPAPRKEARLLLAGGYDARGVGGSRLTYSGFAAQAAVPLGRWLPIIAVRQLTSVEDGPSLDDTSVAMGVQYRLPIERLELRVGPLVRGAVVFRDRDRREDDGGQLQARAGAMFSVVVPVVRAASFIAWTDGDARFFARDTARAAVSASATSFPTFTVGGGIGVETAL